MKEEAPFLDMANDMKPKNYPQNFVYSNEMPQKPPKAECKYLDTVE